MHEGLNRGDMNTYATRWEEAQSRLHTLINLVAYLSVESITISFLNNALDTINLSTNGKTPKALAAEAHRRIRDVFANIHLTTSEHDGGLVTSLLTSCSPGDTPILHALQKSLDEAITHASPTAHYLLTDGVPTDCNRRELRHLIKHRPEPERHPVTLLTCTNKDEECRWMKEVRGRGYCDLLEGMGDGMGCAMLYR